MLVGNKLRARGIAELAEVSVEALVNKMLELAAEEKLKEVGS